MIQSVKTIAREPKAAAIAGAKVAGEKSAEAADNFLSELGNSIEGKEFANELATSLSDSMAVKPIEISADQLIQRPSNLINLPQSNPEAASPKVFDPSLTKGVENLINPQTNAAPVPVQPTLPAELQDLVAVKAQPQIQSGLAPMTDAEVMELASANTAEAKAEFSQAMLKTPQVNQMGGRSPAIELTNAEIDPQLLNNEDFVAHKNLANKKSMSVNGYGVKHEGFRPALENGLRPTEVVNEIQNVEGASTKSVNSQQFILDMLKEQGSQPNVSDARHASKVFDMNHIKSDNSNQIMTQITDYIVQAKAAKEPTVSMRVNHDELGMLDITVRKGQGPGQEAVAINIGAHSSDGKSFFQQNAKELFSQLNQAGISVADFKVETPSQTAKNDFDMSHQGKQGSHGERNFGSEQNQRRHDQNRRQELWDLLKDKEAA